MTIILDSYRVSAEVVDPKSLSRDDISDLSEVTQDMWADGIGEFVQCKSCGYMHSKKDIYGHLEKDKYVQTVRQIMGDFETDDISCQACGGEVDFVFGKENMDKVHDRLQKTRKAFLVIARNERGDIVGYEDAYIDTLDGIYNREFETHYRMIGVEAIRERIEKALGYSTPELLVLSDIGLLSPYRSFQNIYQVLHTISGIMTPDYDPIPGFTEIDEENSLHHVSSALGGISLGIRQDPVFGSQITNTGRAYKSDLIVYHHVTSIYRKAFSGSPRSLLVHMKKYR